MNGLTLDFPFKKRISQVWLIILTIEMREVIDVSKNVLWYVAVFLQAKLKNLKRHRLIL